MEKIILDYIDLWLEYQFDMSDLPGLSVCVLHHDKVIYKRALGYANVQRKEKMTPDHIFRIASHSKPVTATAIMQLVEKGLVRLDDKITDYLDFINPTCQCASEVTIRQLLSHASGFARDGADANFWENQRSFPTEKELKDFFQNNQAIIENNTRLKYSNFGYALLGLIIEKVTSSTYAEYIRTHILIKVGAQNIGPEYEKIAAPFASGYSGRIPFGERLELPHDQNTEALAPATGLYASPTALCHLYKHLFFGDAILLKDGSKKEMFRPQWEVEKVDNQKYGLGCMIEKIGKRTYIGHSGGFPGYITKTLFDPSEQLVVAIFGNAIDCRAANFVSGIYSIINFFKEKQKLTPANDSLNKYFGRFYCLWGAIDFVPAGDKIYVVRPDEIAPFSNATELSYIQGSCFKITEDNGYHHYGEEVTFDLDSNGNIEKVVYGGINCYHKETFLKTLRKKDPDSIQAMSAAI